MVLLSITHEEAEVQTLQTRMVSKDTEDACEVPSMLAEGLEQLN